MNRVASNFIAHISSQWIRQILANFFGIELTELRLYQSSGKEKERCFVFSSSTKREFRHFHVVVVQRRQRNVQKEWCTCKVVICQSKPVGCLPFSLPSPSSRNYILDSLIPHLSLKNVSLSGGASTYREKLNNPSYVFTGVKTLTNQGIFKNPLPRLLSEERGWMIQVFSVILFVHLKARNVHAIPFHFTCPSIYNADLSFSRFF